MEAWVNGSETILAPGSERVASIVRVPVSELRRPLDVRSIPDGDLAAWPLSLPDYDVLPRVDDTPVGDDGERIVEPMSRSRTRAMGAYERVSELLESPPRAVRRQLRAAVKAVQDVPQRAKPLPGEVADRQKVIDALLDVADIIDELMDIELPEEEATS